MTRRDRAAAEKFRDQTRARVAKYVAEGTPEIVALRAGIRALEDTGAATAKAGRLAYGWLVSRLEEVERARPI